MEARLAVCVIIVRYNGERVVFPKDTPVTVDTDRMIATDGVYKFDIESNEYYCASH